MYVNWANLDDLAYYLKQNEDDLKENFDFFKGWVTANHTHYSYRKDLILFGQEKKYLHNWIVSFKNIKKYDVTGISHVKIPTILKKFFDIL